jgi:hypothetical protein
MSYLECYGDQNDRKPQISEKKLYKNDSIELFKSPRQVIVTLHEEEHQKDHMSDEKHKK